MNIVQYMHRIICTAIRPFYRFEIHHRPTDVTRNEDAFYSIKSVRTDRLLNVKGKIEVKKKKKKQYKSLVNQ